MADNFRIKQIIGENGLLSIRFPYCCWCFWLLKQMEISSPIELTSKLAFHNRRKLYLPVLIFICFSNQKYQQQYGNLMDKNPFSPIICFILKLSAIDWNQFRLSYNFYTNKRWRWKYRWVICSWHLLYYGGSSLLGDHANVVFNFRWLDCEEAKSAN